MHHQNPVPLHLQQPLFIDTDINYSLDMSKFPGLDDPQHMYEPALLIAKQPATPLDQKKDKTQYHTVNHSTDHFGEPSKNVLEELLNIIDSCSNELLDRLCTTHDQHSKPEMYSFIKDSSVTYHQDENVLNHQNPNLKIRFSSRRNSTVGDNYALRDRHKELSLYRQTHGRFPNSKSIETTATMGVCFYPGLNRHSTGKNDTKAVDLCPMYDWLSVEETGIKAFGNSISDYQSKGSRKSISHKRKRTSDLTGLPVFKRQRNVGMYPGCLRPSDNVTSCSVFTEIQSNRLFALSY